MGKISIIVLCILNTITLSGMNPFSLHDESIEVRRCVQELLIIFNSSQGHYLSLSPDKQKAYSRRIFKSMCAYMDEHITYLMCNNRWDILTQLIRRGVVPIFAAFSFCENSVLLELIATDRLHDVFPLSDKQLDLELRLINLENQLRSFDRHRYATISDVQKAMRNYNA